MTVLTDIITPALRACGAVPANREPSGPEAADALGVYNRMVAAMRGALIGQKTVVKAFSSAISAEPGGMYVFTGATSTLTLPAHARRGSRVGAANGGSGTLNIDPGPFTVEGAADTELFHDDAPRTWFFDGAGDWTLEADAALTDEAAFNAQVHDPLTAMLTLRLAEEYGLPSTDVMTSLAAAAAERIAAEYR